MENSSRWKKERIPWNKGLKGYGQGHIVTEETRKKISEAIKRAYDKKGRKSQKNELEKKTSKYKQWREQVFKRDNYTCQDCHKKKELHPHHIKPFAKYEELRYEISNGITLCKECHGKIHGIDYNKTRKKLICKECNKKFPVKNGHYKHKFCSKSCAYKYRKGKPNSSKGIPRPHTRRSPTVICPSCKKEFRAINNTYKRKQKYCSHICYLKYRWKLTNKKAVKE